MDTDRMYCPSTDEVIFAPDYEEINENADAFIASWNASMLGESIITDKTLEAAWDKFYIEVLKDKRGYIWDDFRNFLKAYDNPEWIVYECDFYGMACGPTCDTLVFVVKADTVIEEDPNIDNEEEEIIEKTEKEIEDEIIARQIRSLLR